MVRLIAAAASIAVALGTALIVRGRRKQVPDWPIEYRPRSRRVRRSAGIRLEPADDLDLNDRDGQA